MGGVAISLGLVVAVGREYDDPPSLPLKDPPLDDRSGRRPDDNAMSMSIMVSVFKRSILARIIFGNIS